MEQNKLILLFCDYTPIWVHNTSDRLRSDSIIITEGIAKIMGSYSVIAGAISKCVVKAEVSAEEMSKHCLCFVMVEKSVN